MHAQNFCCAIKSRSGDLDLEVVNLSRGFLGVGFFGEFFRTFGKRLTSKLAGASCVDQGTPDLPLLSTPPDQE